VKILWIIGASKPHFTTIANISACDTIEMMLYMKILWNSSVANHIQKDHDTFPHFKEMSLMHSLMML
jgi:hypothetical protein